MIVVLQEDLAKKNIRIQELDEQVQSLNEDVENLWEELGNHNEP